MLDYFGEPEASWFLLVPVGMILLSLWNKGRKKKIVERLVSEGLIDRLVVNAAPGRRRLKMVLRVMAATLIALALMRPQWGQRDVEVTRRGIDLVFAIDCSKSMLAEDVAPNRIERVKQDVRWMVREVVDQDRCSLVAFAGTARTLCPLTLDVGAFEIFLDELGIHSVSLGGTDIGHALRASLNAFGDESPNHKAIILFSDGEGHDPLPETILEESRQRGVRIYTIGIGSSEGIRIPVRDAQGQRSFLRDDEGNIVLTRLDDRRMKTIAQRSLDGAYAHLSAGRANLGRIYADNIQKIEERELQSRSQVRKIDRFPWFLALALVLLCVDSFLPEGRRGRMKS